MQLLRTQMNKQILMKKIPISISFLHNHLTLMSSNRFLQQILECRYLLMTFLSKNWKIPLELSLFYQDIKMELIKLLVILLFWLMTRRIISILAQFLRNLLRNMISFKQIFMVREIHLLFNLSSLLMMFNRQNSDNKLTLPWQRVKRSSIDQYPQ